MKLNFLPLQPLMCINFQTVLSSNLLARIWLSKRQVDQAMSKSI